MHSLIVVLPRFLLMSGIKEKEERKKKKLLLDYYYMVKINNR